MLHGYSKISIVYGGSGKQYASRIEDELNKLHTQQRVPIRVKCINSEWVSHNVLSDVVNALKSSDLVYIVLTLDDIGCRRADFDQKGNEALVPRIRQNVLIEYGMALMVADMNISKIKVIADFKKSDLADDFPSDIRDALAIKEFEPENFDSVLNLICDYVKNHFAAPSSLGILSSVAQMDNFENVFAEYQHDGLSGGKTIRLLEDVLTCWLESNKQFDFIEERIIFSLERVGLFPMLGSGPNFVQWMKDFKRSVTDGNPQGNLNDKLTKIAKTVLSLCIDYTITKSDPAIKNDIDKYEYLADEFENVVCEIEKYAQQINPIIIYSAYDYRALVAMHKFQVTKDYSLLDNGIAWYEKAQDAIADVDSDFGLFKGFLSFNLGRAYFQRYMHTKDSRDKDTFKKAMRTSNNVRHGWIENDVLPKCFVNALSFEYFYSMKEYITMIYKIEESSLEAFKEQTQNVVNEIEGYLSKSSELTRLAELRDSCLTIFK